MQRIFRDIHLRCLSNRARRYLILLIVLAPVTLFAQSQDNIPAPVNNEWVVLVPSSVPPYSSINQKATLEGFSIDVFEAIAERAGVRFQYKAESNSQAIRQDLSQGNGDVLLNFGNQQDVSAWMDFASPLVEIPLSIFVRDNASSIKSVNDLNSHKVALVTGTYFHRQDFPLSGLPGLDLVEYDRVEVAFYDLMSKQVDALIYLEPVVWNVAINLQLSDKLRSLSTPILNMNLSLGVRKHQQQLMQQLELARQALQGSEQYQEIYRKWFKNDMPFWNTRTVFWTMSAVVVVILMVTQWFRSRELEAINESLQQQIDDATVQLSENNAYLKDLTVTDTLTGINNRRAFENSLSELILRSNRYDEVFSMLIFDIDDFKKLNDQYGHDMGDQVLLELVDRINRVVRDVDTLCRWGGEEFTILMPQTSQEGALKMAERCRSAVGDHSFGEVGQVTISLGVTCYQAKDNERKLFKRADDALYEAKSQGKNCVVWNSKISENI